MSTSKRRATKSRSGTGSVFQRADGQWGGTIRFVDVDGTKRRKAVYGSTKSAAESKLDELRRFIADAVPVAQSRDAVGPLVSWWATSTLPVSHRRPSTVQTYQTIVRTVIVPGIGATRLDELTPSAIDAWTGRMLDEGRSPTSIRKALDILGLTLDVAVRDGKIRTNPVRGRRASLASPATKSTSTPATRLERSCERPRGYRLEPLLRLAVFTGLRRGEALALRWRDIEVEAGTLRVTGTLGRVRGRLVRQEPKTNSGTRVVPLVGDALQALQNARPLQATDQEASEYWRNDAGFVFTTESGEPVDPSNLGRWFARVRKRLNLDRLVAHPAALCGLSTPAQREAHPRRITTPRACEGADHARPLRAPHDIGYRRGRGARIHRIREGRRGQRRPLRSAL